MSKEIRNEQAEMLNNLLELRRKIVGVKFYYDEDEYKTCPAQQVKYSIPYCMTVKSASAGHDIKIRKENIGCFAAARALGMTEVTESYLSGEDYMGFGMFADQTASKKVVDNISINPDHPCGLELSDITMMQDDPDLVIIVTTPYNMMRLIQGYNYYYGTHNTYKMGGLQAMCGEITACTYVTKDVNTSMLCAGTRYLSQWGRDELAIGIPYEMFANVVDGVFRTADPLERDGDKDRIRERFANSKLQGPELNKGQNYDTGYYKIGENGIR